MTDNSITSREGFVKFVINFFSQNEKARVSLLNNNEFAVGLAATATQRFIDVNTKYINLARRTAALYDFISASNAQLNEFDEYLVTLIDTLQQFNDAVNEDGDLSELDEFIGGVINSIRATREGVAILIEGASEMQQIVTDPEADYIKDFNEQLASYMQEKRGVVGEPESDLNEEELQAALESWKETN